MAIAYYKKRVTIDEVLATDAVYNIDIDVSELSDESIIAEVNMLARDPASLYDIQAIRATLGWTREGTALNIGNNGGAQLSSLSPNVSLIASVANGQTSNTTARVVVTPVAGKTGLELMGEIVLHQQGHHS